MMVVGVDHLSEGETIEVVAIEVVVGFLIHPVATIGKPGLQRALLSIRAEHQVMPRLRSEWFV